MLIVADEQVEVLEDHLFEAMQQRIERAIAGTFPELSASAAASTIDGAAGLAEQVKAIVERGVENAVNYDIVEGPDFAAFIALGLALRLAQPALSTDWVTAYVTRPDTPGNLKLRMIEFRLRALASDDPAFRMIAERVAHARERAAA